MIRLDLPTIRTKCRDRGITPTELAAHLGVCDATVRSWSASGTRRVPIDAVDQIARLLHCEWRDVLTYTESHP